MKERVLEWLQTAGASALATAVVVEALANPISAWAFVPAQSTPGAALKPKASTTDAEWIPAQSLRYKRNWGVDVGGVKAVESGYMLTFRYRVLNAEKARPLSDKKTRPFIIDEATGVRLSVPAMEKVGELRQMTEPEEGRTYFVIFGNPGKLVRPGSRVTVAIGNFRVEGLVVQ